MNNRGWGLREMIFLSAIILFFVILAAVLIGNLYSNLDPVIDKDNNTNISSENNYSKIEKDLRVAAQRYYRKYKAEIGNIILSEDLIEKGYLKNTNLKTDNDNCEGYVIIDEDFMPFITCQNYETEGY